jgi:hypothetical protein
MPESGPIDRLGSQIDINIDGDDNSSIEWTPELEKLLRKWEKQIEIKQIGHLEYARKFEMRHYYLGVPAGVLSGVITTGTLITYKDCKQTCNGDQLSDECDYYPWLRLLMGLIGAVSTALTSFATIMNYQVEAEKNKVAADGFGSLTRIVETIKGLPTYRRDNPIKTLSFIRERYDELSQSSPTLDGRYDVKLTYEVASSDIHAPSPSEISMGRSRPNVLNITNLQEMLEDSPSPVSGEVSNRKQLHDNDYNYDRTKQHSLNHALEFELRRLNTHAEEALSPQRRRISHKTHIPTPAKLESGSAQETEVGDCCEDSYSSSW